MQPRPPTPPQPLQWCIQACVQMQVRGEKNAVAKHWTRVQRYRMQTQPPPHRQPIRGVYAHVCHALAKHRLWKMHEWSIFASLSHVCSQILAGLLEQTQRTSSYSSLHKTHLYGMFFSSLGLRPFAPPHSTELWQTYRNITKPHENNRLSSKFIKITCAEQPQECPFWYHAPWRKNMLGKPQTNLLASLRACTYCSSYFFSPWRLLISRRVREGFCTDCRGGQKQEGGE